MSRSICHEQEYCSSDWIVDLRQTINSHIQDIDPKIAELLNSIVTVFEFAYEASVSDNVPGSYNWYDEIENIFMCVETTFNIHKSTRKANLQNQLQFLIRCAELEGFHESAELLKRQLESETV